MQNTDLRTVLVAIYTPAGWIRGTMHIGADQALLREINDGGSFFRLTEAQLPFEEGTRDFFAIQVGAASIVLPLETGEQYATKDPPPETSRRQVVCLLPEGTLLCHLDVPLEDRISDYLLEKGGFIPIRECTVPVMELPADVIQPLPIAYLNMEKIIGITETDAMTADRAEDDFETRFSET